MVNMRNDKKIIRWERKRVRTAFFAVARGTTASLTACRAFASTTVPATDWTPQLPGLGVYYRAGLRRAALSLAGDLGLRAAAVVQDEGAPAALTLSLGR